jgi:hypothetical protein
MSNKTYERILVLESLKRRPASNYGNPAWEVTFTDGTIARTQANASISYAADNPEYRGVPLRVTFTAAGRISHWGIA